MSLVIARYITITKDWENKQKKIHTPDEGVWIFSQAIY